MTTNRFLVPAQAVAVLLFVLLVIAPSRAAIFTVTNTFNSGTGSLRWAITSANATPGSTIAFNIAGTPPNNVWTIRPTTALPAITANGTVLDATTQTQVRNSNLQGPEVEIDFSVLDFGAPFLEFQGSNCTIKGLVINRYSVYTSSMGALSIMGNSSRVSGCYIGTDATGQLSFTSDDGDYLGTSIHIGASNCIIGGTNASDRNVLSGNGNSSRSVGIRIAGNDNLIQGNYIGTNATGTAALLNAFGILVSSGQRSIIGGTSVGARNLISGNARGIVVYASAGSTKIQGNYIGTNAAGTASIKNDVGVYINDGGDGNLIGGTVSGAGNLISGNGFAGILLGSFGTPLTNTLVQGNRIGLAANGSDPLPNNSGVFITGNVRNCSIGGVASGEANRITNSALGNGIVVGNSQDSDGMVYSPESVRIRGNQITANKGLGINLIGTDQGTYGVTLNDVGDGDSGPNGLQNYPVLTSASTALGTTSIIGTLNSRPSTSYLVDFYTNTTAHVSGYGEGQTYLGTTTVTTNTSGNASFNVSFAGNFGSQWISAVATSSIVGASSEFSQSILCSVVTPALSLSLSPTTLIEGAAGQGTVTRNTATSSALTISLSSSDTTEATVPANVTIPAGATSVTFSVTAVDDTIVDGTQSSVITASATGFTADSRILTVTDNDVATLSLSVAPSSFSESAGAAAAVGTVTRNTNTTSALTVSLGSSDTSQATVPVSVNIPVGQTSATFSVSAVDDFVDEDTANVFITASAAGFASAQRAVSVLDDDTAGVTLTTATTLQTNENGGTATFSLKLDSSPTSSVSISLGSSDSTEGTVSPATVTFTSANWNTAQTVTVTGVDDAVDDGDIAYSIVTGASSSADPKYNGLSVADVPVVNLNDDFTQISIENAILPVEGDTGTRELTFNVNLSVANTRTIQVQWQTQNDTAIAGADFVAASGVLEFAPGTLRRTFSVVVAGDLVEEANERFTILLTRASNDPPTTFANATATGTITDDDGPRFLSIQNAQALEGDTDTSTLSFPVALSSPSSSPVTVQVRTKLLIGAGVAASDDFDAITDATLTIPAGSQSATVAVTLRGDKVYEGDEIFEVELFNPQNAALSMGQSTATGTIQDDDPLPVITSFAPTSGVEGTSVVIDGQNFDEVLGVKFDVIAATWTRQSSTRITAIVPAGASTGKISVSTEAGTGSSDSNFQVLRRGSLRFQNSSVSVNEGDGVVSLVVSRLGGSDGAVSVKWTATVGTASSADFGVANGILSFADGETSKSFTINIAEDVLDEDEEFFVVTLSDVSGGAALDSSNDGDRASVAIADNDASPTLSIRDTSAGEGTTSSPSTLTAQMELSAPSGRTVTVQVATSAATTLPAGLLAASAGTDYTTSTRTVTFTPGQTSQSFSVVILPDEEDETDEVFTARLSSPSNATLAREEATLTIIDNDGPIISIAPAQVTEGSGTNSAATFTVTLSAGSPQQVRVEYATRAGSATNPDDFTATMGTLTFAPQETSKTISVPIVGDTEDEVDETFHVRLSNPVNAFFADNAATLDGTGTIRDDDGPGISIDDVQKVEGDAGTSTATFTVTLSAISPKTVTVNFATADGTALAPDDYTSTSGSLTFAPTETSKTISVPVVGDKGHEANESFAVNLSNPSNATLAKNSGVGTILDDDDVAVIVMPTLGLVTTEAGDTASFTVKLSSQPTADVTLGLSSSNRQEGTVTPTFLTFNSTNWNLSQVVTATGVDDEVQDGSVIYTILTAAPVSDDRDYSALSAAVVPDVSVTNLDNDTAGIMVSPTAGLATTEAGGKATFSVKLNTQPTTEVAISLSSTKTSEGTVSPASLLFTPQNWSTAQVVTVTGVDDDIADGDQNYTILTAPAVSGDVNYHGLNAADVDVVNRDNQVPTLNLELEAQLLLEGKSIVATLKRNTLATPALDVALFSSDMSEATVPATVTFVAGERSVTFRISGTQDEVTDGSQNATIRAEAVGLATASIALTVYDVAVESDPTVTAGDDAYNLILGPPGQQQQTGVTLLSSGVFQMAAPGVLVNDGFVKGTALTVRPTNNPKNGRFQLRNDGSLFYLPSTGTIGVDEFTYSISDGKTSATARVRLNVIDKRAPELAFDTPRDREVQARFAQITGRVRDRNAGLKTVTLLWQRFDGKSWNGSAWTASASELPLKVQGINWSYNGALPTDVPEGRYNLRVSATDNSGNLNRVTNRITLSRAAELSPVRLSAATVTSNSIVLTFTGALDANIARQAAYYKVSSRNVALQIGAVSYNNNTVTLSGLDLQTGESVALQLEGLRDASGKTLKAATLNLTAR